jgi:hypothetical protein
LSSQFGIVIEYVADIFLSPFSFKLKIKYQKVKIRKKIYFINHLQYRWLNPFRKAILGNSLPTTLALSWAYYPGLSWLQRACTQACPYLRFCATVFKTALLNQCGSAGGYYTKYYLIVNENLAFFTKYIVFYCNYLSLRGLQQHEQGTQEENCKYFNDKSIKIRA